MKRVLDIYDAPPVHWVGDGFPVRSLFTYNNHGKLLNPFLLLDYAGPADFSPAPYPRGVGQHPHRGFETVTLVYQGEVAHRDSTGKHGVIGPGDVQWMTAAAGILHEEFHSEAFTRLGGQLEMVQLWVNLPAEAKMTAPHYQAIYAADIPIVNLPDNAGSVRVIAGNFQNQQGAAHTYTPLSVWDLRLQEGKTVNLSVTAGWNVALVVLRGEILMPDGALAGAAQLVILGNTGNSVSFEVREAATVLLLSGEPINEPVVGHGPFVMNTQAEIDQALTDFNSGRFG